MLDEKANVRETLGMALCSVLSMGAFGALLFLWGEGRLPAFMALAVSWVCPIVWIVVLLWQDGNDGGLIQWIRRGLVLERHRGGRTLNVASAPAGSSARLDRASEPGYA